MPKWFKDWEEPARSSPFDKAVSAPFNIQYHGETMRVEIVKPLSGDAYITKAQCPGFVLSDRRPTTAEVDAVEKWQRHQ
jgi:hypothetical protein